jgi:uncharacterized damage-inducible protein DinB
MTPEQAKIVTDQYALLMEGEIPTTLKVLAAVKNETRDYRPDEKSRTAWELATHMATSHVWFLDSIMAGAFTFDGEAAKERQAGFKTSADVVAFYKEALPARIAELRAQPPATMARLVDVFGRFKSPAAALLGMANNHCVHHRGQLAAYLRAMGSKVPAMYGPSADEKGM